MTDTIIFIGAGIVLALALMGGIIYEIAYRKCKLKSVRAKAKAKDDKLCKQKKYKK